MNYWTGVALVALLQAGVSALTIAAGTGNGSFVGLGAMLLAVFGLPITALVNLLLVRDHRREALRNTGRSRVKAVVAVSLVLPLLQLALLVAQVTLRL